MKKILKLISAFLTATILSMNATPITHANPRTKSRNIKAPRYQSTIKISNLHDLNRLRELSNQGEDFENKTIILENDIYIKNVEEDGKENDEPVEFQPIFKISDVLTYNFATDEDDTGFKGTFDGNGKTLHLNVTNDNIFGSIGKGGVIKNLNITGRFEGDLDSGIIALSNSGIIDNVNINTGTERKTTMAAGICYYNKEHGVVNNCNVTGNFSTNNTGCAGICVTNTGTVKSCKFSGKLTNCHAKPEGNESGLEKIGVGGITTLNTGFVKSCHIDAELTNIGYTGGIVSINNGVVENSTFNGTISSYAAGGIVGINHYGALKSCKANATIEGQLLGEFIARSAHGLPYLANSIHEKVVDGCEFVGSIKPITEKNQNSEIISNQKTYGYNFG